uniref:Sideroflexin 4 n=1 Tax=Ficedula albicollis TaxID=59894 RepID=A0A803WDF5_FICAL
MYLCSVFFLSLGILTSAKAGLPWLGSHFLFSLYWCLMSAFTVAMVRSPEFDNGIEVMDRNGNVIGVSKKAGEKAVMETALSRAVLFGTTFFLPEVLMYFVQRARFVKNPRALGPVRMFVIMSVLAGMLPVSFSMFPQCGEIKRADLEPEILTSTEETEFFYNRGI